MHRAIPVKTSRRCVGAAAVLAALVAWGPSAQAITLRQAYDAALKNDPTYRSAFYDNEAGKEYLVLGRAGLLPGISASYSANKTHADQTVPTFGGALSETHPQYLSHSAVVQLRQPVLNLDGLARYKQGRAQSAQSDATFTARTQEMIVRVFSAYSDALFAQEVLALTTAQRDTYVEQMHVNNRLFEKGEGTKTDMLETQARLDLAEAQLLEARDNERTALATLAGIVGEDVETVAGLSDGFALMPLAPASFDEWKQLALKNNPALQAQQFAVEAAQQEISKARAGHAPRLDVVATYSHGKSETLTTLNQDATQRTLGVQLSIPLYAGGAANASTRQAVAGHERAKADLQARTDQVLVELRKQHGLVMSSVARMAALEKAVNSGELLVTATEQSIKGGVRINLDLLNAKQALTSSRRDLAQARYGYLLGLLRLKAAAGTLVFDDVRLMERYFR